MLEVRLLSGALPVVVYALGAAAGIALLVRRHPLRWLPVAAGVAAGGLALGAAVAWLLGDVLDLFEVSLSFGTRAWFAVAVAGIGLAVARAIRARGWMVVVCVASALVFLAVGAVGVNADLGEFPTVGAALGLDGFSPLLLPPDTARVSLADWRAPAGLPSRGRVGTVTIPATVSGFGARAALVYLPPAALVRHPPRLPVMEMMSGQPGGPSDLFVSGGLATSLDAYARAHHGLAPIVVVPDQLGAPARNPMCVDSALGRSASYLTVDVPAWITAHLGGRPTAGDFAIAGFSQGGTCAIQLGAEHPSLYGAIFDISGQVAPRRGSLVATITQGFHSSEAAYRAAVPAAIMRAHAPYRSTFAVFAYGQDDARYGPGLLSVAHDAAAAGMTVTTLESLGTAHDWHTVHFAIGHALALLGAHWRLDR